MPASRSFSQTKESILHAETEKFREHHRLGWLAEPQGNHAVRDFVRLLFRLLEEHEIRYCVLHSWEGLPDDVPSELDLAIHPDDAGKWPLVVQSLSAHWYLPLRVVHCAVKTWRYDFAWFDSAGINCMAVYSVHEYREGGLIVVSGEALVADRERHGDSWVADPKAEFAYLLAKRFWDRMISPHQEQRLRSLEVQLGRTRAQKIASELFPDSWKRQIAARDHRGYAGGGSVRTPQLQWTNLSRNPIKVIRCVLGDSLLRAQCWFRPTGLFVVTLGPDGVGKSTLIKHLIDATASAFRGNRVFHWRPMSLWRRKHTGTVTNPHGQPPHSAWWSVALLFSHVLDYWLGYWWKIRPLLARSSLVVFDRYFYDLMIDPRRYRYGGPRWLIPALSPLIPKPDLVLVLDAPDEVILSRKREVEAQEVRRQRQCYRRLARGIANADLVRTDQAIDQIVSKVSQVLAGLLIQRAFITSTLAGFSATALPPLAISGDQRRAGPL